MRTVETYRQEQVNGYLLRGCGANKHFFRQTIWIMISGQAKAHLDLIGPDNSAHTGTSVPTCSWPRPSREEIGRARPLPPPPRHTSRRRSGGDDFDQVPSPHGFQSPVRFLWQATAATTTAVVDHLRCPRRIGER